MDILHKRLFDSYQIRFASLPLARAKNDDGDEHDKDSGEKEVRKSDGDEHDNDSGEKEVRDNGYDKEESADDGDEEEDRSTAIGYASVFNSDSCPISDMMGECYIEQIAPIAFNRTLTAVNNGTAVVYALWSHDWSQILGSTRGDKLALTSDDKGLQFQISTNSFDPMMLNALSEGNVQMSFGFIVRDYTLETDNNGVETVTVTDLDLLEISFVAKPAYNATSAGIRSLKEWRDGLQTRSVPTVETVIPAKETPSDTASEEFEQLRARAIKAYVEGRLGK